MSLQRLKILFAVVAGKNRLHCAGNEWKVVGGVVGRGGASRQPPGGST